jgi:adenylylsulfate kinase
MRFTLWFMGRPAAGKSTIAKRVESSLRELDIPVENLDGDEIRKNLHPDLGFTREDRATNNRRTAFICNLLNRNNIAVVTGMITPFRESQNRAREIVEEDGEFVLVYVNCSLEECERRDPKNLYEQAREDKIPNFTGISHPFQEPHNPDIVVDTEELSLEESHAHVLDRLEEMGILDDNLAEEYSFDISRSGEAAIKDRLAEMGYLDGE